MEDFKGTPGDNAESDMACERLSAVLDASHRLERICVDVEIRRMDTKRLLRHLASSHWQAFVRALRQDNGGPSWKTRGVTTTWTFRVPCGVAYFDSETWCRLLAAFEQEPQNTSSGQGFPQNSNQSQALVILTKIRENSALKTLPTLPTGFTLDTIITRSTAQLLVSHAEAWFPYLSNLRIHADAQVDTVGPILTCSFPLLRAFTLISTGPAACKQFLRAFSAPKLSTMSWHLEVTEPAQSGNDILHESGSLVTFLNRSNVFHKLKFHIRCPMAQWHQMGPPLMDLQGRLLSRRAILRVSYEGSTQLSDAPLTTPVYRTLPAPAWPCTVSANLHLRELCNGGRWVPTMHCEGLLRLWLTVFNDVDDLENFVLLIRSANMRNLHTLRLTFGEAEAEAYVDDLFASLHLLPNLDTLKIDFGNSRFGLSRLKDSHTEFFRLRGVHMLLRSDCELEPKLLDYRCRRREIHR